MLSDTASGNRALFGTFDPFTKRLRLDDGETPGNAQYVFRDPARFTVADVEVATLADQITLAGTWTETTADGAAVFTLTAERSSGSQSGRVCDSLPMCPSEAVSCPGGALQPPASNLLVQTQVSEAGCLLPTCTRVSERAALCPGVTLDCRGPSPVAASLQGNTYWLTSTRVSTPCVNGTPSCAVSERCLNVECVTTPTAVSDFSFLDDACLDPQAAGPILMASEGIGLSIVNCPPAVPYCTPFAPVCPLGAVPGIPTTLEPVQTSPCFQEICWQHLTDAMLCPPQSFADPDPCVGAGEVPALSVSGLGCVDITCEQNATVVSGAPCNAIPSAHLPAPASTTYGVDVTDTLGCPNYRAHQP